MGCGDDAPDEGDERQLLLEGDEQPSRVQLCGPWGDIDPRATVISHIGSSQVFVNQARARDNISPRSAQRTLRTAAAL